MRNYVLFAAKKLLGGTLFLFCASNAHAGMTVYDLNDLVKLRLQDISFFAFLLLLATVGVRLLWNYLAKDFVRMPRLSFLKALSLTGLISIALLLVLAMISGARELLTPGAWYRQGSHYRPNDVGNAELRQQSMQNLREVLREYARTHESHFPPHDYLLDIPDKIWQAPDSSSTRYIYIGGLQLSQSNSMLACEPPNFGSQRLVLFVSGQIKSLKTSDIYSLMRVAEAP